MDADWSVELGHGDPALEFPWSLSGRSRCYVDLLHSPESISEISEARQYPELAEFLLALNVTHGPWQTVKCDVWLDGKLDESEQIYDATLKFCSYVDLVARDAAARYSFERHEQLVKSIARQLSDDDGQPIACEFIVRRCWYHTEMPSGNLTSGFYVTFYLFGYGSDEDQTRRLWAEGLRRVTAVIVGLAPCDLR